MLGDKGSGGTASLIYFVLSGVVVDSLFSTTVFGPLLFFLLPIFSFELLISPETVANIDNDGFWSVIKRWCDATTMTTWVPALFVGINLISDDSLWFLLLVQWFNLPGMWLFWGWWTVVFFPVTFCWVALSALVYGALKEPEKGSDSF